MENELIKKGRYFPDDPKYGCHWERTVPFTDELDLIAVGSVTRRAVAAVMQNTQWQIVDMWHTGIGITDQNWYSQSPYTQWLLSKVHEHRFESKSRPGVQGGSFKDFFLQYKQPETIKTIMKHIDHLNLEASRRHTYNLIRPANCEEIYTLDSLISWIERDVLEVLKERETQE